MRKYYLDLLRIFACIAIVFQHIAAMDWYSMERTGNWLVCNFYDATTRFGVPVFFMISGVLFLDTKKEISIKKLYIDHVLRFLIIYGVWSVIYGIMLAAINKTMNIQAIIQWTVVNSYHMWFLPVLIGIYMLVPVLKLCIQTGGKKVCEYMIVLFFLFQILRETLYALDLSTTLNTVAGKIPLELLGSYVGYFVLGYYLHEYPMSKSREKWIYILGMFGLLMAFGISTAQSFYYKTPTSGMFDSFALPTFLASTMVFTFFVKKVALLEFKPGTQKLISSISGTTLGIYLAHVLFGRVLINLGIMDLISFSLIKVPFITALVFIVCGVGALLLRKIPFIGKYIC